MSAMKIKLNNPPREHKPKVPLEKVATPKDKPSVFKVIFHLSNGTKRYSIHRGEVDRWSEAEIDFMRQNRAKYGNGAFTADFRYYHIEVEKLRARLAHKGILEIVDFEVEPYSAKPRKGVIKDLNAKY